MNPGPLSEFKIEIFAITIAVATKGSASDIVRGPGYASYKNLSKKPPNACYYIFRKSSGTK